MIKVDQKDSFKMHSTAPSLTMAVLGLMFMVQMSMAVSNKSQQVAVIVPPWSMGGMQVAAGLNAPVVDIRWQGHVIILDVSRDPLAVNRLHDAGFFLLKTNIRSGCISEEAA
jgi:hypothetical protein